MSHVAAALLAAAKTLKGSSLVQRDEVVRLLLLVARETIHFPQPKLDDVYKPADIQKLQSIVKKHLPDVKIRESQDQAFTAPDEHSLLKIHPVSPSIFIETHDAPDVPHPVIRRWRESSMLREEEFRKRGSRAHAIPPHVKALVKDLSRNRFRVKNAINMFEGVQVMIEGHKRWHPQFKKGDLLDHRQYGSAKVLIADVAGYRVKWLGDSPLAGQTDLVPRREAESKFARRNKREQPVVVATPNPWDELDERTRGALRNFIISLDGWVHLSKASSLKKLVKIWQSSPKLRAWLAKHVNTRKPSRLFWGKAKPPFPHVGSKVKRKYPIVQWTTSRHAAMLFSLDGILVESRLKNMRHIVVDVDAFGKFLSRWPGEYFKLDLPRSRMLRDWTYGGPGEGEYLTTNDVTGIVVWGGESADEWRAKEQSQPAAP